jgi:hypothetical protein
MIYPGGGMPMKWKLELDALIESTMAYAKDIKRGQSIADSPVAMTTIEQALANTSSPPIPSLASQRDKIRERVRIFKAHQDRLAREREEYYLQVKARMLAPVDSSGNARVPSKNPPA